ncbi:MAG: ABC1 kinase family protein [bacterium]|nr:ABC1 kinase family protein [bacterium]
MSNGRRSLSLGERLERARRISLTFGRIYLRVRSLRFVARRVMPPDIDERWEALHERNAQEVYDLAVELQGMILKGCQFASARADVLPRPYQEILGQLQDKVPAYPFEIVREVVEKELGKPLNEVFLEFAEEPLAAASLAQVHVATLHNGTQVAVKVQYPEIAALVRSDLTNLRVLFRAVGWLEPDFDLMPLADELGTNVPLELDFMNEGRNAERVAGFFATRDDVAIPAIHWEHSSRRVLVMELMQGRKITDVQALRGAGVNLEAVMRTLIEVFAEMILAHGFFHGDPHPGNLLVEPESGKLVILDFGLAKELPAHFRETVLGFATALLQGDSAAMGHALIELGFETRDGQEESLHEIAELMLGVAKEVRQDGRVDPETMARLRKEVPERIRQNPIVRIPHHLVLVGRVLALLTGLNAALSAKVDFLKILMPIALGVTGKNTQK